MKNKKINKNTLFYTLITGCLLSVSLGLALNKVLGNNSSINTEDKENNLTELHLNFNKINSRKIGDEFEIIASFNDGATFQSCTFEISDATPFEIVKQTNNSIKLRRIKDFENFITITAYSDDPFVNLYDSCKVRCYNSFKSFNALFVSEIKDSSNVKYDELKKICDEDQIILKQGLTYTCQIICESLFSYLNDEDGYFGDTYISLEDDTIDSFITQLGNLLNNAITTYSQNFHENECNTLVFTFTYNNILSFNNGLLNKTLSYENEKLNIELKSYVAVNSFQLNKEGISVI